MKFNLDIDAKRWREAVKKWPKTLAEGMRRALNQAMKEFREEFRESRLRGRPGLNRRSGALFNSFRLGGTPEGTPLNRVEAWLASTSPYASIHETGGTITPRRRKFLAIPLAKWSEKGGFKGAAVTKAGAMRGGFVGLASEISQGRYESLSSFMAGVIRSEAMSGSTRPTLYGVQGLRCIKSRKGNLLLVDERKLARGNIVPLFVLKRSVTIPPRLGFYSTFRSWIAGGGFIRHVRKAIRATWNAARAAGRT